MKLTLPIGRLNIIVDVTRRTPPIEQLRNDPAFVWAKEHLQRSAPCGTSTG